MVVQLSSKAEYDRAALRVRELALLGWTDDTEEALEFSQLCHQIREYEAVHFPKPELPHPVDAIEFWMDQQGGTIEDLVEYLGPPDIVREVMARRRPLTLDMIRKLHAGLGISAEILIQEFPLQHDNAA